MIDIPTPTPITETVREPNARLMELLFAERDLTTAEWAEITELTKGVEQ